MDRHQSVSETGETPQESFEPVGPPNFERASASAAEQLRAIPSNQPVRLHKRTSNLFRAREQITTGLDLSAFTGVYRVDPVAKTALVGGLTTYEDLVAATLPYGLVPLCVPQLRTITLGGAVTGMGIEAASFRNGMPHESVLAMDILVGDGRVLRASPTGPNEDLFAGFPNSYGSLGYALRLEIELESVPRYVALRHVPFASASEVSEAISEIASSRSWAGETVDYLDGTVFSANEMYLTLGRYSDEASGIPSDYSGQQIYYRSIQQRSTDLLTVSDFLWRWDTDWFWCSRTFGAQNSVLRRLWPKQWLRSNVYWQIAALDRRYGLAAGLDRMRRRPPRELVVQDVEVPLDRLAEFLDFFHREIGIAPVWICPLRQRATQTTWPLYELDPDTTYVNVGFWSSVELAPGEDPGAGRVNRAIEAEVTRLHGRKSLYSTAFYERDEFYRIYGAGRYQELKDRYDPSERLTGLFEKCVSGS
jgi:FAD/FMN-containing dehydrogenase